MFLTSIMQSFLLQYYLHHCYLVGMKLKTALLGLIYDKVSEGKQAGRQEGIKARRKEERRKAGEKEGGTNGSRGEGARGGEGGIEGRKEGGKRSDIILPFFYFK